jgi:hypothetical protein
VRRGALAVTLLAGLIAPSSAHARCTEQSESGAVGYTTCDRFGSWSRTMSILTLSPEFISLSFSMHRLDLSNRPFKLCGSSKCDDVSYGGVQSVQWPSLRANVMTGVVRGTVFAIGPLRLGIQCEVGGAPISAPLRANGLTNVGGSILYYNIGTFVGGRASIGHVVVGVDALIGANNIAFGMSALKVRGVGTPPDNPVPQDQRFALHPEVNAVYYVHPFIGVGLRAGGDALYRDDLFAGVLVRFSLVAYEGTR